MDDRQDSYRDDDPPMPSEGLTVESLDEIESVEAPVRDELSPQTTKRREELALYLDQLEETRRSGADLRDAFSGLELDTWELTQLEAGLGDQVNRWQSLIAEGVAFRNKYETDLGWAPAGEAPSYTEIADFRRILITDAALGIALLEETQQAVNEMILNGDIDEAKQLTGFRNKIGNSVTELKTRVGEEGYLKAESLGAQMVTPPSRAVWTSRSDRPTTRIRRSATKPMRGGGGRGGGHVQFSDEVGPSKSRLKPLLIVLGVFLAIWAVFVLPKQGFKPLPELTVSDVSPRSEIRHVVARPPSLFVELDTRGWAALAVPDRLALVEDVGRTAEAAGYTGANFKLENGKTAAQWLKERGSEVFD